MVRVIKELRPTWIVGENVAGIVKLALPDILSELEAEGYRTRTFLIPACAVGARHRRYRVAIVAYSDSGRQLCRQNEINTAEARKQAQCEFIRCSEAVQYTNSTGCQELRTAEKPDKEGFSCGGCNARDVYCSASQRLQDRTIQPMGGQGTSEQESERSGSYVSDTKMWREQQQIGIREETWRPGSGDWRTTQSCLGGMADGISPWMDGYWDVEPDIPRIAKGIPNRVERLKGLGNAVVPQQFYPVLKAIADVERSRDETVL